MKKRHRNKNSHNRFLVVFPMIMIIIIGIITTFVFNNHRNWEHGWEGIRKEIKDSIEVAGERGITSGVGGLGRSTMDEVQRRRWIMQEATTSELNKLTHYPDGTIKAIAYEGLLKKKGIRNKTELILRAINDTIYLMEYQSGCFGWNRYIGAYLVQEVLVIDDKCPPPYRRPLDFGITEMDKKRILKEFRKRPQNKEWY